MRAPYQVLVFPYHKGDEGMEYAIFHRSDADWWQAIAGGGEVGIAKPNVKLFETACKRVSESPNNCYYIGDDLQSDILPCIQAGMRGIWINRKNEQARPDGIKTIFTLEALKENL